MKKWTEQQDEMINVSVRLKPDNLRKAFEIVADVIKRTPSAVCTRYYNHIKKQSKTC